MSFNTIYFHMGPGFHSLVEKEKFGASYGNILFVDQPLNLTFSNLVDWGCDQVDKVFQETHGPVHLLGHSFGGQIIAEVAGFRSQKIKSIRLLNSAFDPFDCFVNLANALNSQEAKSIEFWKNETAEKKMELIFQIAGNQNFPNLYWLNKNSQEIYNKVSSHFAPLHIESFVKTFSDFLKNQNKLKKIKWQNDVKIIYSAEDILIGDISTVLPWKEVFPSAQFISIKDVGHYAYFESKLAESLFFQNEY